MNTNKTSITEQSPATTNSIAESKPKPQNTSNLLEGYISNSWNGGIIKPIAYKKIMAGEKITNYSINGIIRMLTPKVPVAQKLTLTLKAFFVPNSRVWANHDKYMAQKGGVNTTKIIEKPHFLTSKNIANMPGLPNTAITGSVLYRDSFVSSYIPRIYSANPITIKPMVELSLLPIRGFKAIYNDKLRHKIYDEPFNEYDSDTMSDSEWSNSFPNIPVSSQPTTDEQYFKFVKRGRRKDSYYTNYRTESQGQDYNVIPMYSDLMEHNEWQKKIAESRSQAENEQKNDWDIIAELRGSKPLSEGKVQFISMKEIGINYQQVSQTTYNTNQEIQTDQQTLGATGAFSYTDFNVSLIQAQHFIEEGYIHIIAQTSADTVFETGLDRNELNITWDSEYRPDFVNLKEDTLNSKESNGVENMNDNDYVGFKRKFSEYFKLPNIINGDMTSTPIWELTTNGEADYEIPLKKEFQFFELADIYNISDENGGLIDKNRWHDYTDLLINKNLAVRDEVITTFYSNYVMTRVKGANQLFMIGTSSCITNQPIDESIKQDFKKWGEQ